MKYEDIKIRWKDTEDKWAEECLGAVNLGVSIKATRDVLNQNPQLREEVEWRVREHITRKLYEEVNKAARKAWVEIRESLHRNAFEPWVIEDKLREHLEPLSTYGRHLVKKPE